MPAAVDGLKQCSKCGETKPVSEYNKSPKSPDRFQYTCRSCQKKHNKKHYENNKERIHKRHKEYRKANKEYLLKQHKKYRENNKEHIREYKKEYRHKLPAGVYKIENKITGKIYIGQSTQYPKRWQAHRLKMRHRKHHCLQHDCDKYGIESFEFSVIQEYPCDTDSDILFEHEQRLIDEYIAEGKELYNTNRGS